MVKPPGPKNHRGLGIMDSLLAVRDAVAGRCDSRMGRSWRSRLPTERCEASDRPEGIFVIGAGGVPATIHHANLGLITGFLPLSGVYLLSSGEVAAVYGAEAIPIGVDIATAP